MSGRSNGAADARLTVEAFAFAAAAHAEQVRKNGREPFVNHLAEVAALCARVEPFDADLVAAALLHDTIEKTGADVAILAERFGADVAALVAAVTDPPGLSSEERRRIQVEHVAAAPPRVRLLKLADKTSNLAEVANETPPGWSSEKLRAYAEWARAVAAPCLGLDAQLDAAFEAAYGRLVRAL